jgi:membrane protein YdbS with pleckstrin-like domain
MDRLSDCRSDPEDLVLDAGPRALLSWSRALRYISIIIYLAIEVFIANSHHYFADLNSLMAVVSALLAVLLWPLVLLGVNFHLNSSR